MTSIALVTGAARGIGAATVRALADADWRVLALDVCADDPTLGYRMATRAELDAVAGHAPDRITAAVADVRDVDGLAAAVATAETTWGGLDAAIACAGVIAGGVAQYALAADAERTVLDVNLLGVLNLARVAMPALLRRTPPRSGRFVAVASAAATRGLPMLAAYCAAKAGVVGLVQSLAVEVAAEGITVNAVSPGSTGTAILDESARLYDLPNTAAFAGQQPLGRLVHADEVARAILFLASAGAGAITGTALPVDGGMTL
jgi:SDR family mycofactocin-dependent oxidoreductase